MPRHSLPSTLALSLLLLAPNWANSAPRAHPDAVSITGLDAPLMAGGASLDLHATPLSHGAPIEGLTVTWSIANNAIATLSSTGRLNAIAAGATTITAEVEGVKGTVRLEVFDASQVLGVLGEAKPTSTLSSDPTQGIGGLIGSAGTRSGSGPGPGLGGGGTAAGLGGLGSRGAEMKYQGGSAVLGVPTIDGALDRSLVDSVLKRSMSQIRYCYERELTKNLELGGTITTQFVIIPDGTVSSAVTKSTTMNNALVETCINGRLLRMTFPVRADTASVTVTYPITFAPPKPE